MTAAETDMTRAVVAYNHKGRTFVSHVGQAHIMRRWAMVGIKNHRENADKLARPMCIVRLKALK